MRTILRGSTANLGYFMTGMVAGMALLSLTVRQRIERVKTIDRQRRHELGQASRPVP